MDTTERPKRRAAAQQGSGADITGADKILHLQLIESNYTEPFMCQEGTDTKKPPKTDDWTLILTCQLFSLSAFTL